MMKKATDLVVLAGVLCAATLASAPAARAQTVTANLVLQTLSCSKTVDSKGDKIYVTVGGRAADGSPYSSSIPPFDMKASGGNASRANLLLWGGELRDGQAVDLQIVVTDKEARHRYPKADEIAAGGLLGALVGRGVSALAGGVTGLGVYELSDKQHKMSDHLIGSFAVRIRNRNGKLETAWEARDQAVDKGSTDGGTTKQFWLNGAGSEYTAYLQVSEVVK
jgi:hypothetical protein